MTSFERTEPMQREGNTFGFTLLEVLLASVITVAITAFAAIGVHALLNFKGVENEKLKLAFEASRLLDEIEENWGNKCISLGNLLIDEGNYPFQFRTSGPVEGYPSLSFFRNTSEGPRAICYGLAPLPSVMNGGISTATGLFRMILDAEVSAAILESFSGDLYTFFSEEDVGKLIHCVSDWVVLFEIHLVTSMEVADGGCCLDYLNVDIQSMEMYAGEWTLGATHPKGVTFAELTIGLLPKSFHGKYFELDGDRREDFLGRNGFRLSRLLPWRI